MRVEVFVVRDSGKELHAHDGEDEEEEEHPRRHVDQSRESQDQGVEYLAQVGVVLDQPQQASDAHRANHHRHAAPAAAAAAAEWRRGDHPDVRAEDHL